MRSASRVLGWVVGLLLVALRAVAAEGGGAATPPEPDAWLDMPGPHPVFRPAGVSTAGFEGLSGRLADRGLEVRWAGAATADAITGVTLWASTDPPGHWGVRDWRVVPMQAIGGSWMARVPVPSVMVPTVYFLEAVTAGGTNHSPMRIFRPQVAGLVEPTLPFRGYLDGFEDGLRGWELASGGDFEKALSIAEGGYSGRKALRVQVPASRGSVTVGTVRVRGWMLWEHGPRAIRLMARCSKGSGRVACSLHSEARTENLAVHPAGDVLEVGTGWRRLEWPLESFAGVRWRQVDWVTLQFFADGGGDLLLDDVELVLP